MLAFIRAVDCDTALFATAKMGNGHVAKLFLHLEKLRTNIANKHRSTPLPLIAEYGHRGGQDATRHGQYQPKPGGYGR